MEFTPSSSQTSIDKKLSRSLWFVTHRADLVKGLMIFLAIINITLFGFAVFVLADWAVGGGRAEAEIVSRLTKSFTNFAEFRNHYLPHDLVLEPAQLFPVGDGTYDIVIPVTNPNQQWWANLQYVIPGEAGSAEVVNSTFILPGETKYLYRLGVSGINNNLSPSVTLRTINWSSLNNKIVQPDYSTWSTARLGFETTNPTFVSAQSDVANPVSRASFTVNNATAFGYKNVGFFVILMGGGRIVGFNHVTATDFAAGETRDLAATWYTPIGSVTRVIVQPEINIFDPSNQLK